ncbi:unnamed protein product [Macrosiphum euphorbiae]|uniref:Uncharacterized protein n=1 Tax=Macrosiphum euphorbiae TaxID=13131 RepID=A0AAV0WDC6_9HEMI|nr:unnamed protein product [Macrosiphum euphorbiae]
MAKAKPKSRLMSLYLLGVAENPPCRGDGVRPSYGSAAQRFSKSGPLNQLDRPQASRELLSGAKSCALEWRAYTSGWEQPANDHHSAAVSFVWHQCLRAVANGSTGDNP